MAEQFGKSWLETNGLSEKFRVISRGLTDQYEPPWKPCKCHGLSLLQEQYDIDMSSHRSALLTAAEAEEAIALVGVTRSHAAYIRGDFPDYSHKVTNLSTDVSDPWHQPKVVYQQCAAIMKPLVEEQMERLCITDRNI